MATLGSYKKKIKSAKNIAKITKAMQLVAASKMKRAQLSALAGKEYAEGVYALSGLVSDYYDEETNKLGRKNTGNNTLVVVIAPEKGLCGSLVTNLTKFVNKILQEEKTDAVLVIGKKARQIAGRVKGKIIADFDLGITSPNYDKVPPIARIIEEQFVKGLFSKILVVYSEFINTMEQMPKSRILLPLTLNSEGDKNDKPEGFSDYKFEPTLESIANPLFEMYLEVELYQILLESYASEQSARMVAMKNATDNATSLISDLTVEFNKARQSAITSELLDIQNSVSLAA